MYNFFGIKEFIYFISSSQIQDALLPVRIVFIFFSVFFLVFVIYFMVNSSWLQYKFLEDVTDFFFWKSAGQREMSKQWAKIKKRTETGNINDYKLAIIDADDFFAEVLDDGGYAGKDFAEAISKASKMITPIFDDVLAAHEIRNSIIYNPDYNLSVDQAKKVIATYESASRSIGMG